MDAIMDFDIRDINRCPVACVLKIGIFICIGISVLCVPLLKPHGQSRNYHRGNTMGRDALCFCCDACGWVAHFVRFILHIIEYVINSIMSIFKYCVSVISSKLGRNKGNHVNEGDVCQKGIEINKQEKYKAQKYRRPKNQCREEECPPSDDDVSVSPSWETESESSDSSGHPNCDRCSRSLSECVGDCPVKAKHCDASCTSEVEILQA
ncbi:uncharacterized protein LOC128672450 [Plodia interpunctella]|uniref:uncharacterized protein LOC128672450 n=1 Tax=Plodia interpunctella TaxID=58824 RepID=UPI0023689A8B|nr:uncharacterized protein LOC128672450 [Plodia interpunctella]